VQLRAGSINRHPRPNACKYERVDRTMVQAIFANISLAANL
jgi:hypothetical protein